MGKLLFYKKKKLGYYKVVKRSYSVKRALLVQQDLLIRLAPAATCLCPHTARSRRVRHPERAAQVTEGSAQHRTVEHLSASKCTAPAAFLSSPHRVGWGMSMTNAGFTPRPQPASKAWRCDTRPSKLACAGHKGSLLPSSHLVTGEPNYSLMRRLILQEIPWWKCTQIAIMASNKCKPCLPQKWGEQATIIAKNWS